MSTTNGVCDTCGSGVIEATGEHMRDGINCPLSAEFWWENHTRLVREGTMGTPFARNPNDIRAAIEMSGPAAHEAIREALKAGQPYWNIAQYHYGDSYAIYTAIARLLDAGVLCIPS